jgi:DNA replication and repair protein RecF
MRQRNELLKKKTEEAIEPWEMQMAQSAAYLLMKRVGLIENLKGPIGEKMTVLSKGCDLLDIAYEATLTGETPDALFSQIQKNRRKELHLGLTLYGPHRDDVHFSIGGLSVKGFGSIGQKHCVAAALRLCLLEHIQGQTRERPIFSIDDFGAHLDPTRQEQFREELKHLGQIFITSPNVSPEVFPEKKIHEINFIKA